MQTLGFTQHSHNNHKTQGRMYRLYFIWLYETFYSQIFFVLILPYAVYVTFLGLSLLVKKALFEQGPKSNSIIAPNLSVLIRKNLLRITEIIHVYF